MRKTKPGPEAPALNADFRRGNRLRERDDLISERETPNDEQRSLRVRIGVLDRDRRIQYGQVVEWRVRVVEYREVLQRIHHRQARGAGHLGEGGESAVLGVQLEIVDSVE